MQKEHNTPKEKQAQFKAVKGKIHKPGTGGVYRISDHLYEGRFTPTNAQGKREVRAVYAHTEAQREGKLAVMIAQVKAPGSKRRKPR